MGLPPEPSKYEMRDGEYRPAFDETNVLIEIRARVDGRLFTAREAVDPMLFNAYGFDEPGNRLEGYLKFFIQSNFGKVAVSDADSYRYFRDRVWVVRPEDEHDLRRCKASATDATGTLWPRCLHGTILRELPGAEQTVPGAGIAVRRDSVLGICPCRCHKRSSYSVLSPVLPGVGQFDEAQLDEKDDLS